MTEQFTFPEKNELTSSEYQEKKMDEVYLGLREGRFFLKNSESGAQLSDGSFYVKTGDQKRFLLKVKDGIVYEEGVVSEDFRIEGNKIIYGNGEKITQENNFKQDMILKTDKLTVKNIIKNYSSYIDSSEIKQIPYEILNDKTFILNYFEQTQKSGLLTELYSELNSDNQNDPEIIFSAINSNSITNISDIPEKIQKNMPIDIGIAFVKIHGLNMKFLPKSLQNNFDIALEAVKENHKSYEYLTEEMKKLLKDYKDDFKDDEKTKIYI